MTPELAAACAEIEGRIAADNPEPPARPQERSPSRQHVVAGPAWPEHLPRTFPQSLAVLDAERPDAAPEPDAPRGAFCGYGGFPRCRTRLERRGLCGEHAAVIRAVTADWQPSRPKGRVGAKPKVQPPAQTIDPADIFDAAGRARVPAIERAAHMATWIHRVGRVRRADAARVAGVDPEAGTMRGVLAVAEARRWIVRDARGALLPGDVAP